MLEVVATTPPESLRVVYEKCRCLQARSLALRQKAWDLHERSCSLRELNAILAMDMSMIRASADFVDTRLEFNLRRR